MEESNMAGATKLLKKTGFRKLGARKPVVAIEEEDRTPGTWSGRRLLRIGGNDVFELSFWCGTCELLFDRLDPATNETVSLPGLQQILSDGISEIDGPVIDAFSALLPKGKYLPMLLEIEPTLVTPGQSGDYFVEEQYDTWRDADDLSSIPENPGTPYYRADTRKLDANNSLFEFVVPLVPPSRNEPDQVNAHEERLAKTTRPTCVALSILDVRQRTIVDTAEQGLVHWGLSHFLLDGHHKIEAAARSGSRLQVLSLISLDNSLAKLEQIERLPTIFESSSSAF